MNTLWRWMRFMIVCFYGNLLPIYPKRFRTAFNDEIRDTFLEIVNEAEDQGGFCLLKTSLRELSSLVVSIVKERWHALKSRKEGIMTMGDNLPDTDAPGGGSTSSLQVVGMPGWKWIPIWTVVTTVSIPVALIMMAPLAALSLLVLDLGVKTGILSGFNDDLVYLLGLFIGLSLSLSAAQTLLLRNYLPRVRSWFVATAVGLLVGGLLGAYLFMTFYNVSLDTRWGMAVLLLLIGLAVGCAQWLVLRHILPNALWILAIDVAAACSLLIAGRSITSLIELLIVPMLPGLITGLGLWLLLRESPPGVAVETHKATKPRSLRIAWFGMGVVALVPLFFLCIWVYTTSQLALAKNEGIYATAEEAVIATNSRDLADAKVIRLENVYASPNSRDGSLPHVWFGGATVYLDRAPQGWDRTQYLSGSLYIHVKDGWVHVPEGAFPEFIGWVMQFYGLEDVNEWIAEN